MIKCEVCKKELNQDSAFVYNGMDIYCCSEECFTSYLKKKKEIEDRNLCYATISRIFGVRPLTPKLLAEVKRTCEKELLSYNNLAAVLHYMYEIKCIPIYSPTLYYVPQYKEEASKYYKEIQRKAAQAPTLIKKDKERNSPIVKPNYNTNKRKTGLRINPNDV